MARRRCSFLLFLAAFVLLATGCQVAVQITVTVEDDGSGDVEVELGLDADAMTRVPDLDGSGDPLTNLDELLRTADLESAGWAVSDPEVDGEMTTVRITKPFGTPQEATAILAELTGSEGPLVDLRLDRSTSFGTDRFVFEGTADLSGGLAAFSDEGLAEALEGEPLGEDEAAMEERFGLPAAEMFSLDVRVHLPGGEDRSWSPELGGAPVAMEAESTLRDPVVWGLAGVAGVCIVALVVVLGVRVVRRR